MRLHDYEALKQKGFSYSRTHLWRLIKAGQFPKPVKLGGGARNSWIESERRAMSCAHDPALPLSRRPAPGFAGCCKESGATIPV
jgi:prophage regulatory protein